MNADALIAPAVAVPVVTSPDVGSGEVGTLSGSVAETKLDVVLDDGSLDENDAAEPGCVAVDSCGIDPVVVAGGNGAMVVGATPACWVGCPTCACEVAWELVWAWTAPTPPSHTAITKMNMRCIAFSHHQTGTAIARTVRRFERLCPGRVPADGIKFR
jgi:hypothetical protein